jgi:hypothetical protein
MDFDPRLTPRLRDRALTRLNDLTTGAAVLGVVATAGLGTVAALTTHAPGASAASSTTSAGDDPIGEGTAPREDTTTAPSTTDDSRSRIFQLPSTGGTIQPPTRGSGRSHASTGGS